MGKRMVDIAGEVIGRWPGIFYSLGIEVGDGRHMACPLCGGKDRFRMDNKEGRGTYFCSQCGSGDGFALVQAVLGCDFKQAAEEIRKIIGGVTTEQNIPKENKMSKEYLRSLFFGSEQATEDCQVGKYLKGRGLNTIPKGVRFHPKCKEPETQCEMPTMLGVFMSSEGEGLTMHRTFLDGMGNKATIEKPKKILPALGKLQGGAIRLFEVEDTVAIAEGIETALAVNQLMNVPCWSVVSSTLMESFEPPKGVKNVIICADNDKNFAGQRAAFICANRLALKGYNVTVRIPDKPGTDFLDELA